jgi:hypothetical protein
MSEDESWRSESAYSYIDELSPGDLAWEFLRRNPDYRKAYQDLVATGRLTEEIARDFANTWGLRFRGRSRVLRSRPADLLDPTNRSRRAPADARTDADRGDQPPR